MDYGSVQYHGQFSRRVPIIFQCVFATPSGGCMWFLPDTPRRYYARGRPELGDDALCSLSNLPLDDPKIQRTRQEIFMAMEAEEEVEEEEAKSSLNWTQFLTSGITDKTPLRIVRRHCICFWLYWGVAEHILVRYDPVNWPRKHQVEVLDPRSKW